VVFVRGNGWLEKRTAFEAAVVEGSIKTLINTLKFGYKRFSQRYW
jgi:hypothetical protein